MKKALQWLILCLVMPAFILAAAPVNILGIKYYRALLYYHAQFYRRADAILNELPKEVREEKKYKALQEKIDARFSYDRALDLFHTGKYEQALTECNKAFERDPRDPDYSQLCGEVAVKLHEYDMAVAYFKKSSGIRKNDPRPYYFLAYAYFCKNEYRDAMKNIDRAIAVAPKDPYPYSLKASIYDELWDYENAVRYYAKYYEMDPKAQKKPRWELKSAGKKEGYDTDRLPFEGPLLSGRRQRGYLGSDFEVAIPPQFVAARLFYNGIACIYTGHEWRYIDKSGRFIADQGFEECTDFASDEAIVKMNGEYRFLKRDGTFLNEDRYQFARPFSEDMAVIMVNDKWGFVDKSGRTVIAPAYDWVWDFGEGLAAAEINGKTGFIDKENTFVIPAEYRSAGRFCCGLAPVAREPNKYSYIDKRGKVIIPGPFKDAQAFEPEGFAFVAVGDKKGAINTKGELIIEPKYNYFTMFFNGIAGAKLGDKMYHVNRELKFVEY